MSMYEEFRKSGSAFVREGSWGEEDACSVLGSLLECTDQSDFPICLANEMMTYGGNMNSFDEASFFNAVKWVGGRCACVSACLCGSLLPAGSVLFQQLSSSCRRIVHVCVELHISPHRVPVSFWINSVNPFKHSCTWFILSLWGYRNHPTVVHCSQGSSPFFPLRCPNTHNLNIHCITHIIDIHHTSVTVYPSVQQAAKPRIQSVYISALWSIYKSFLSRGW